MSGATARASTLPRPSAFADDSVDVVVQGQAVRLSAGDRSGSWTFMGVAPDPAGKTWAIFEDFTGMRGDLVMVDTKGNQQKFPKSLEPTFADPKTLYLGHTFKEVLESNHDLLGAEILAREGDPNFAALASCFAPITRMDTYTFVGTRGNSDKVGVAYGGRTANFDPAIYVPDVGKIRAAGKVLDGLVGGWLPVVRFVYPEKDGDWSELVIFAPQRTDSGNTHTQPVWYRVSRVEQNELKWVKYFDTYLPSPPRSDLPPAAGFYRDLLALRAGSEESLSAGMRIELPDERLANQARHSLVRAMITRMGSFPKYGVLDRNYGGAEHDGFQDTFNVDTTAMLEWGLFDLAHERIDNYLTHFVRDDGSILYRGPETGQYGRMLTVLAEYYMHTRDAQLLLKHRDRIDAITRLLLSLRQKARELPRTDSAYGMIAGWCEADSCLEADPSRYLQPYFSNSCEAVRGFADLGSAWQQIGRGENLPELTAWGATLRRESTELSADLQTAIGRSLLTGTSPACLPAIAGVKEPFDVAVAKDIHDPQFRTYRAYMEMLFSGCLTREEVETIVRYREAHRDIVLGIPVAYSNDTHELAGFLSYGHAYGLLQHDFIREYLLELYSLSAHQYTRGTWTAPETRCIDPDKTVAPYCVPAQLSVPLLVRWMLAFEDPNSDTLWLCKGTPREWLKDGSTVAASAIPTRRGRVGFRIHSHLAESRIDVSLDLPDSASPGATILRLRAPSQRSITSVLLDGKPWTNFDRSSETISLPASASGKIVLQVGYQ